MLSGFVISYAYDNSWNKMSLKDFFIRRLVRLQPMIIVGSIIGALLFYFQTSEGMGWGNIANIPVWKVILLMFIGMTVIPVGKSLDIRGWSEMHPLNGPSWSLFFEYIANIVYALFLKNISKLFLTVLVVLAGLNTIYFAFTNPNGDLIGGWSLDEIQLRIGFTRLAFPFLAGILLARASQLKFTKNAFLLTSVLLIAVFSVPRLGGHTAHWQNALYECFALMVMFPLIIWLGAGGKVVGQKANAFCKFLGDISYPIYITHFPLVYVYMAWVSNGNHTMETALPMSLLTVFTSILIAYLTMKYIDIPTRKWLSEKLIKPKK